MTVYNRRKGGNLSRLSIYELIRLDKNGWNRGQLQTYFNELSHRRRVLKTELDSIDEEMRNTSVKLTKV